jgi:signal transduction histidine kinase
MIANPLLNAIEASPRSCTVRVSARNSRDWRGNRKPGVRLTIVNTGSSIAPEIHVPKDSAFRSVTRNAGGCAPNHPGQCQH